MIAFITGNAQKFNGTFYHANWRITITAHNAITQRTMVGTNAHGSSILFANFYQRSEAFTYAFNFLQVFSIAVFEQLKLFLINVIARVHPNFLYNPRCNFSRVGGKVN